MVLRRFLPDTGGVPGADAFEEVTHRVEACLVGDGGVDHRGQRAGTGRSHQRAGGNQVREVQPRNAGFLRRLHDGRRADRQVGLEFVHCRQILLQRRAVLHMDAVRVQPVEVGRAVHRLRAGRADVAQIGAAFDQQAGDQQFGPFIAAQGDATLDRIGRQRTTNGGQEAVSGGIDLRLSDIAGVADGLQPGVGTVVSDRRRADNGAPCGFEFPETRGIERMDPRHHGAIEGCVQLAPLTRRDHRTSRQAKGFQHCTDADRIHRKHFAHQGNRRLVADAVARRLHRALLGFGACVSQHRAGQYVLCLGVRRHAEPRHVDADDAHAVDVLGQQLQRHTTGGRHAQVDDDHCVVLRRIRQLEHRFADVFEQLAGHQRFAVERHVTHAATRTVEVRGKSQSIDAAGRTRQHGRGTAHAQADTQRAEGRTHRLRLIVRTLRIIQCVLIQHTALAGGAGRTLQLVATGMAAQTVAFQRIGVDDLDVGNVGHGGHLKRCRTPLRAWA